MKTSRLEAFSDGVLAIVITIMVLEMKVPHGSDFTALQPLLPVFSSYVLSFLYLGIYWNNHHHMLQAAQEVNGSILWANLHLLFWLSLIPFVTGWVGESDFSAVSVAAYGFVLLLAACAYWILSRSLISHHGEDSMLARAVGSDTKGRISIVLYAVAIPVAFVWNWVAVALYVVVALIWVLPDRRIEKSLRQVD